MFNIPWNLPNEDSKRVQLFRTIFSAVYYKNPVLTEMPKVYHLYTHKFSKDVIAQVVGNSGDFLKKLTHFHFPNIVLIHHNKKFNCFDIWGYDWKTIHAIKKVIFDKLHFYNNAMIVQPVVYGIPPIAPPIPIMSGPITTFKMPSPPPSTTTVNIDLKKSTENALQKVVQKNEKFNWSDYCENRDYKMTDKEWNDLPLLK